jgi:uncharacterized protein (TIGR03000 family)
VFINGRETTSTGSRRQYVSRGLTGGYEYDYHVRVESEQNGQTVTRTESVKLKAGDSEQLAFNLQAPRSLETSITLHVPEGAKVTLAGSPTDATGRSRTFTTTGLQAGQQWNDYTIRVSVVRRGRIETREKKIDLKAGDRLTFDFNLDGTTRLAAAY